MIIIILTIYSSQISITKYIIIPYPSLEDYQILYQSDSQTLICPCKNVVTERQTFLTIQPNFHQICLSAFVDGRWSFGIALSFFYLSIRLNPASRLLDLSILPKTDFRTVGPPFFRSLRSLCNTSKLMLHDRIEDFNRTSFPTTALLTQQLLQQQGQSLINLLYTTSQNEFVNILRMNRDWVYTNNLVAGIQPPITLGINVINNTNVQSLVSHTFLNTSTSSCSCYDDPTCVSPVTFFTLSSITRQYPNPELYYGCYIFEAVLKSNLAFLYDQNWIDEIRQLIQFDMNNPANFITFALNASIPSQFNITTSLSIIVDQMMTEPWYTNVNYNSIL